MEDNYAFLNGGEVAKLIRTQHWASQALQPEVWPDTLKIAATICMTSGFPIAILWGTDFKLLYNDAYSEILGDKHPKALGQPLKYVYPEVWSDLEPQLELVLNKGETLKHPDTPFELNRRGYIEECYFDYSLSPIYLPDGSVGGIFNVVMESTEKKLNERRNELLGDLARQQNISQPLPSCIKSCTGILKTAARDIPFFLIYLQKPNGTYELVDHWGVDAAVDNLVWPVEEVTKSGTAFHIAEISTFLQKPIFGDFPEPCTEALIVPIKNSAAASSGYLVTGLSPRKKYDPEYGRFLQNVAGKIARCFDSAKSFEAFMELEQEKDNLLGVISHELKTPITGIKAYTQLAMRELEKNGDLKSAELIKKMSGQADKLSLIIADMLDGSNFKIGSISLRMQEFDFDQAVASCVGNFSHHEIKHHFILNLEFKRKIHADQHRIEQVIHQLISNAVKYSAENSRIEIHTRTFEDKLLFSISDQGIGIRPEEKEKIFERFYRSINIKQYSYPGIGLGLFIAREIVKHSGGRIWFESEENTGTIFYFSIPLQTTEYKTH